MLSVITATYNRRELLLRKLESLQQQTLEPDRFEWLVCVNGSTDGTLEALQEIRTEFRLELIPFSTNRGVSAARNACVQAARGSVLYFSDDDCLPEGGTLERHLTRQGAGAVVALGGILFEHAGETNLWEPERVHYWNLNGANSSLPKEAFERVGGFDETLTDYGGEDVLLGYRLSRLGLPFVTLPHARTRHQGPEPQRARDLGKARSAGRNAMKIAQQHPELGFRLGVHSLSLLGKALALYPPFGLLWRRFERASYDYERAYLEGALEERYGR